MNTFFANEKCLALMLNEVSGMRGALLAKYSFLKREDQETLKGELDSAVWSALYEYEGDDWALAKAHSVNRMKWAASDFVCANYYHIAISKDDYEMRRALSEYMDANPHATYEELAKLAGVTKKTVLQHTQPLKAVSLDKPVELKDDTVSLMDCIAAPEEEVFKYEHLKPGLLEMVHQNLDARAEDIVLSRTGFYKRRYSEEELGEKYSISHQMVSKIYKESLKKLQCALS